MTIQEAINHAKEVAEEKYKHKDWLRSCPIGDCNFKTHLSLASNEDILSLLSELQDNGNKTKKQTLQRELKRRKVEY